MQFITIKTLIKNFFIKKLNFYPYRRYLVKNQAVFIHIPKCAGTSILSALGHTGSTDHATYQDFLRVSPSLLSQYFSFTVVRDPVGRFVSLYSYYAKGGNMTNDLQSAKHKKAKELTLTEFISWVEDNNLVTLDFMLWPQVKFICNNQGEVLVDFVANLKTIEKDFKILAQQLKLDAQFVESLNTSNSQKVNVSQYDAERIKKLYEVDYMYLGYYF